jgi:hypothetical protein
MLDNAAALLDQLGAAGTALAPQILSTWKDGVTGRRTMLGPLDPAATDPASPTRPRRRPVRSRLLRPGSG